MLVMGEELQGSQQYLDGVNVGRIERIQMIAGGKIMQGLTGCFSEWGGRQWWALRRAA